MSASPDPVRVIETKRDGGELTAEQIDAVVDAFTRGEMPPEQMSALAMAVYFRGLSPAELTRWTAAMVASGERLDLSGLERDGRPVPTVDKHSTGGVGDAITLVLTPLLATYPVAVPQLSGRGLGHTGGTLDKLEAVPGWRPEPGPGGLRAALGEVGAVICAADDRLAPADRRLYALRDVTGTVPSIPLIASSIMAKKIAEGTSALVLDVKCGSGAFLPAREDAVRLARTMVRLGEDSGVRTSALVTAMHTPLGRAVGNALEVAECVGILAGGGPADMVDLTCALAREALSLVGVDTDAPGADPAARLADGRAMDAWRRLVAAQGGDPDAPLPVAAHVAELRAPRDGVVRWDALGVGRASWTAGAGRSRPGQSIDPAAGVWLDAVEGERVAAGATVAHVHAGDAARLPAALDELAGALELVGDGAGADGAGADGAAKADARGRGPAGVVLETVRSGGQSRSEG